MLIKLIFAVIAAFLHINFCGFAYAEDKAPQTASNSAQIKLCMDENQQPVSLEEVLRATLNNNYNIKIVSTQKEQNRWTYYNTLTSFLPDFNGYFELARYNGSFFVGGVIPTTVISGGFPSTITTNNIRTGINAQWIGFNGFNRFFTASAARSVYRAAKRNLDLTVDQALLLATRQYYTLLQARLDTEIRQRALEETKAELLINQQRFNAGVGTKFDVLRAEAQVESAVQNLISSFNNYRLAQAQLAYIAGFDVFSPLAPCSLDVKELNLFKDCLDLDNIRKIALKNKPEIDIARFNVAAARASRNSGYSVYLPSVAVTTSVNGIGTEISNLSQNNIVALSLNWQGGRGLGLTGYTGIRALNEQVKASKLSLINTTRGVEQSIINSFYNILTSREIIKATRSQVISAEESLRLARVRLQAGVGIYTDVIAAQLTETQARINYLNSLISYNVSQVQLLYDMGIISADNILNGFDPKYEPNKKN